MTIRAEEAAEMQVPFTAPAAEEAMVAAEGVFS